MQSDPSNNNVHSILKYSDVKYRIMFFFFSKVNVNPCTGLLRNNSNLKNEMKV